MENWTHDFATVNGVKLHHVTHGEGKPIVLMHGFPEFWYSWRQQISALAEAGFKVIAVDMRGYNQSDKPRGVKHYTADVLALYIKELIGHLGYEKAYVVGHDWGGAIAWQLAINHPEVIEKLAVLNCPLPVILQKHLLTNFKQVRRSWYMFMFQVPGLAEWTMGRDLLTFFKRAFRGWSHNKAAFPDEVLQRYVEAFTGPYALTAPVNYYRAALGGMFSKKNQPKGPIMVDTLLIWGEDDKALGKELTYDTHKYMGKSFYIKYIEDSSHWVQQDAPELVNGYLVEFFKAQ
jgi:pimeloyl-ACP methyl ester carboxylesterase